jgi:hypothetical protein
MANLKDFIKKLDSEVTTIEEQNSALDSIEKTVLEIKQRQELPIEQNDELTQLTLSHIEQKKKHQETMGQTVDLIVSALKTIEAKLEAKLAELNNTPAKQGVQGPTGKAGKDGKNGQDGRDGVSGKDGTDGKDGVDGQDGVSVVDAKIDFDGSLVVYLSNGNEIDCGQILSPDVAQNIIINSGGSGTSQTVTDTLVSLQNQINTLTGIDGVLGDMAQQNANAVAITGGTINGTTIGATTPSSVNATTITGQTGVLRGTGQNLVTQSQTFNSAWGNTAVTINQTATTAPNGTATGNSITPTAVSSIHRISSIGLNNINGITYTASVYAKANGYNYLYFNCQSAFNANTTFNLSTGAISATASGTATITAVGDGWYRCTVTGTASSTNTSTIFLQVNSTQIGATDEVFTGNGTSGIFLWGAQLEVGSIANTYLVTTSAVIYGTPTLSFSGVSSIGLQSNGSLFVQPAGTGALQAQATTSTTAGGNARGANAVDWQTTRDTAARVASATAAVISGGANNTTSGTYAFVGSGYQNSSSQNGSGIVTGAFNAASGQYAFVGSGNFCTASGFYGFVGNGFTNSTTSSSAVTTQSGTMNATTAVTLSGSNANIKVGQYISGTSIGSDTYVAAISGTSLTLSKNASGSSTSTLSFFTPHGVVVGGGNNQATGSYSFIGGGGNAGTAANRNVASGDWSVVTGGSQNTASGGNSSVLGGGNCSATSSFATCLGGAGNTASGFGSTNLGGNGNVANATYAIAGGFSATNRSIPSFSYAAGSASVNGDAQTEIFVLRNTTTDATATAITIGATAPSTTNQVILPNNSAYFFTGEIISGVTGGGNTKGWTIEGVIKRGANAASTALVGTPTVTSMYADVGAATWAIAVTADTTNGGLRVTFTGQAATTIRTVCQIRTTEMTF